MGSGKGVVLPLLPPHKFTPHDVVALRPSKGAADGPALVQGEQEGKGRGRGRGKGGRGVSKAVRICGGTGADAG